MDLSNHACRNQYIDDCARLNGNLARLSQGGLKRGLITAVNQALTRANVPTVTQGNDAANAANACFRFQDWRIVFGAPLIGNVRMTQKLLVKCANTVYHEARHCEQWFRMAQAVARGYDHISNQDLFLAFQGDVNRDASAIHRHMHIQLIAANAAVANPDYTPVQVYDIRRWWRSIYAVSRTHRGQVLAHIQDHYDDYRALAEEVDAWRLGDSVEEEVKVRVGMRDDRPSYFDWRQLTKAKWYNRRSNALRTVDRAFERYERTRSGPDKNALRVAFQAWYTPKNGITIRNGLDIDELGIVEQLEQFLS
jgi:hypothetical protein